MKQLSLKTFQKATILFEQIKHLDKEIIEIDRLALLLANGETQSAIEIKVRDIAKAQYESEKISFDDDGSIIRGDRADSLYQQMRRIYFPGGINYDLASNARSDKDNCEHSLVDNVSESIALQVLGVLLGNKQTERQNLINKLQALGVVI